MSTNNNNAIVAYEGRPTNSVEHLIKRVVASKSESKYKNDNTTFTLLLYENQDLREEFHQGWFITQLIEKLAINTNTKGHKSMRAICKLDLD